MSDMMMTRDEAHALVDEIFDRLGESDLQARSVERRLQLADLAIGSWLRQQLQEEIAPLDNLPEDPETEHRRGLMMLRRFMLAISGPKLANTVAGDVICLLNGTWGQLLRPVGSDTGSYNAIEQSLIRRYVLRVYVECARECTEHTQWLRDQKYGPSLDQFRKWSYERVPQYVPPEEREIAKAIGDAFRDGRELSREQASLWDEIKDGDLTDIWIFLRRLPPNTVRD
jgi:hypothetical protein